MKVFFRIFSAYLIMAMFIISCKTYRINNFSTVIKKEQKGYRVFIDTQQVVFSTTFIDRKNVKSIIVDRKNKKVFVNRKVKDSLIKIKDIKLPTPIDKNNIIKNNIIYIVNGIPVTNIDSSFIESNYIKSIKYLKGVFVGDNNLIPVVINCKN